MTEITEAKLEAACAAYWPNAWYRSFDEDDREPQRAKMLKALEAFMAPEPQMDLGKWETWGPIEYAACHDCGEKYGSPRFPDLVIPHDVFAKIATNPPDGGLFCPNCLCARLEAAGIEGVVGKFTSGPLAAPVPAQTTTAEALRNIMASLPDDEERRQKIVRELKAFLDQHVEGIGDELIDLLGIDTGQLIELPAGTPSDMQIEIVLSSDLEDFFDLVQAGAKQLRERGAQWQRVTFVDGRYWMDGWLQRPAVEAEFEILKGDAS